MGRQWKGNVSKSGYHLCFTFGVLREFHSYRVQVQGALHQLSSRRKRAGAPHTSCSSSGYRGKYFCCCSSVVLLTKSGKVHAALDSWKAGRYNKQDTKVNKFSGESFKTVYQHHVKHLEDLKANHPLYFHRTMAKIYAVVVYVAM